MSVKFVPAIQPHVRYIEVFNGGQSLLFHKRSSPLEVINDSHSPIINLYRILRDDKAYAKFRKAVVEIRGTLTNEERDPYSWWNQKAPIQKAAEWFVTQVPTFPHREPTHMLGDVDGLPMVHAKLQRCQIEHNTPLKILDMYDDVDTFFYVDPTPRLVEQTSAIGDVDDKVLYGIIDKLHNVRGTFAFVWRGDKHCVHMVDRGWNYRRWIDTFVYFKIRKREKWL